MGVACSMHGRKQMRTKFQLKIRKGTCCFEDRIVDRRKSWQWFLKKQVKVLRRHLAQVPALTKFITSLAFYILGVC